MLIVFLFAILCDLFMLVSPLHTYLCCSYIFSCLFVHVIKHCSKIWFGASSHPFLYMKSQDPLLGALLVGMHVVHNSFQWIHRNQIQTYICPLWIHTLFVCLFVHRLSLFVCLFTCFPPLLVCFYMLTSFACLLCICLSTLSSCLLIACDGWSTHATYKRKAKGHILADLEA